MTLLWIETVLKCPQSNHENHSVLRETQMQGCGLDLCFKEEMVSNIQVLTLVVLKEGRSLTVNLFNLTLL